MTAATCACGRVTADDECPPICTTTPKETAMNAIPTPAKTRTKVVIWSANDMYWMREHFQYVSQGGRTSVDSTFAFRSLAPAELDALEAQALNADDQVLLEAIADARNDTVATVDRWWM